MRSRRRARAALPLLACAALAACGDAPATATAPRPAPAPRAALAAPASAPGTALLWLPPLAPARASYAGTFDGSRAPVVELCRWSGTACEGEPVARWTLASGPGGEPLRVVTAEQHYRADWKGKDRPAGAAYRVRVLLDGGELGRGDYRVLRAGESEASVLAAGYVPVSATQTVLIRFRLETSTEYLAGSPGAPTSTSIARETFVPRAADYSTTHPALPGAPLSHAVLALSLAPQTTVAEANALLADLGAERVGALPGAPGEAGGILVLRLSGATSHQRMDGVLARLRADARVRAAAPDVLMGATSLPAASADVPEWRWGFTPGGGNWGHEHARVPQLWNLNAAIAKRGGRALAPRTGVVDNGFARQHPDLVWEERHVDSLVADHGTHVAGIIGATYGNGVGVDGVNPFARLAVRGSAPLPLEGSAIEQGASAFKAVLFDFEALVAGRRDLRVVNMSLGYNFTAKHNIPLSHPAVVTLATEQGKLFVDLLRDLAFVNGGLLPVVVTSSGNDSATPLGPQEARYNSPMCAAGLVLGAAPVIVVGGSMPDAQALGGATRLHMSNTAPHVYAPGGAVSTMADGGYAGMWGTSQAAPYVTGLVGYLYTLRPSLPSPTLAANAVRDHLVATGTTIAGAGRPHVDAFAAAMALDDRTVPGGGTREILRLLVDVDDGTVDGNTRVDAAGTVITADAHGDGHVDMRDFRRWRDWVLAAEKARGLALDGAPDHPKKDLNGDGVTTDADAKDDLYPRGDFNGDGRITRSARRAVPGAMRGVEVTDLEMLQELFSDTTGYTAAQLPALVNSGDVAVDASRCLAEPGVVRARVKVHPLGASAPAGRALTAAAPVHVATVPVDTSRAGGTPYVAVVEALDASGQVTGSASDTVAVRLGGDVRWAPECGGFRIAIDGAPVRTVMPGDTVRVQVIWIGTPPADHAPNNYGMDWLGACTGDVVPFGNMFLFIPAPTTAGTCRITVRDPGIEGGAPGSRGATTLWVGIGAPPVIP